MKKPISCIFFSLITSSAFGEVTWIETNRTEADILNAYQHRILHITTSTFGPYSKDMLSTIVTTEGIFRCATKLSNTVDKIPLSLSEEKTFCAMIKAPEEEKSKKKKRWNDQ